MRRESDLFYAAADDADPTLGVPSCPGWTVEDLVWHLGEVHWFWGTDIEMRAADPDSIETVKPKRPVGYQELIAWGRAQADRMISLLEQNDDSTTVWTWSPPHQTVGFIRRHQVQEASVHRWDMQNAAMQSPPDPVDPEVASDSIDELLAVTLPWVVSAKEPLPGRVHIHCMDTEGEWFVESNGSVEAIHAKGDVALRGTASDLLLAAYKRVDIDKLEMIGDEGLAWEFIERINTE
ncbi:MAG: maleylpyruvate isomerase family mycothiol-dependent enzyme [Nitrososphaerales archaeon]